MEELTDLEKEFRNVLTQIEWQKIGPNSKVDELLIKRKEELKKRIMSIKFLERGGIDDDKYKRR